MNVNSVVAGDRECVQHLLADRHIRDAQRHQLQGKRDRGRQHQRGCGHRDWGVYWQEPVQPVR